MNFDAHFLGPIDLQETQRRAVEAEQDVGRVLHDDDAVGQGEVDDAFVKIARGHGPGRAVGVIDHQQLGPLFDVGRDAVQVGQKAVFFEQRQIVDFAAVVLGVRAGDRDSRAPSSA